MTEESVRGPFRPTKTIVLSELSTRERELYYTLLVTNNAKFYRDEEGRYVGNVRILAPHEKKVDNELRRKGEASNYSISFQERLTRLKNEGFIDVTVVAAEHLEYNSYPRFTALIANNGDTVRPRQRPFTWVMKIVEDIFDHRFSLEKNDIEREDDSPSFDLMLLIFPVFVVRKVGTNVGLKTIVDQTCWDLLYNVNLYRKDYLELEIFGRFLQEFYDHDDLLFFLYVRSVLAKVLHISFKARWQKKFDGVSGQPKALWISFKEAAHVARIVFGSDNEGLFRDFMHLITPQMVGEKSASGDSRRIDITEYLHLSVVGYHQSQSHQHNQSQESRMLVPIPGQLVPDAQAPSPTGITYSNTRGLAQSSRSGEDGEEAEDREGAGDDEYYSFDYPPTQNGSAEYTPYTFDPQEYGSNTNNRNNNNGQQQYQQGQGQAYQEPQYDNPYDFDDPYGAAELAESLDLQSLASSPIGRVPQQAYSSHNNNNNYNQNSSTYLQSEDIPFDRSSVGAFTEIAHRDAPSQQGQGGAQGGVQRRGTGASYEAAELPDQEEEPYQEEELNPFEQLQAERESEFLGALIEPLSLLPEEYAQYATNDLGDRLRQTVQIFLEDKDIRDLTSLDGILTDFLSLDALRSDMESFRDEIIEYYMQDDGTNGEGGAEGQYEEHEYAEAEHKTRSGGQ